MASAEQAAIENKEGAESDDLLSLCRQEMQRAIGFENDQELIDDRERALNYIKGDMKKDIPNLPNRSKAISTDLNDAIETTLPDLLEIFIGGDDVVAFIPTKPEDEEGAEQETAYLNQVVFQDNPGFDNFYTAFKDALTLKTGIWCFEWKQDIQECEEKFTGKNVVELIDCSKQGEIVGLKPEQEGPIGPESTFSFTLKSTQDYSQEKIWTIAPDDFAVGIDTIILADATYCCQRSRPRVQELLADGYDRKLVEKLPNYVDETSTIQQARDTAGENTTNGLNVDDSPDELRQVEIRKHHIRRLDDEGKLEIWAVVTDSECNIELSREKVSRIRYAVITPYKTPHRFYGRSLADMLADVQRIKTMLLRMLLDAGYFAQNQRAEIDMSKANDFTISDYLRNEPGVPIRVKSGGAINPVSAANLNFNVYEALEYFSTVSESRTGVVRNAQGLNPDTLHDTAKGALTLIAAAQKRIKMIARIFAETGVKDLYLGVHADIRENARASKIAQLLGKWVQVDPTKWAERNMMHVSVGLGASGKEMDIAAMKEVISLQAAGVQAQGGTDGPLVTKDNLFNSATTMAKKLGVKNTSKYFSDPANAPPMPPQPNPEIIKIQGEQQLQQSKLQGEMALGQAKVAAEKDIQANKSTYQAAADTRQQDLEHQRMQAQQANEMALEQAKIASTERLEQMKMASAERIAIATARIKAEGMIAAAVAKGNAQLASDTLAFEEANETAP